LATNQKKRSFPTGKELRGGRWYEPRVSGQEPKAQHSGVAAWSGIIKRPVLKAISDWTLG